MSNARNLADVISGNYDVPAGSLDNVDLSSRVAKTGDTMTGVLTIQNTGFDSRITLQNTGTGGQTFNVFSTMDSFTQGGGNLLFHTSSAPNGILKMDSAGRVTMPYQPAAYGARYASGSWTSSDTRIVPDTITTNIGNHMSGGVFTCPVAGLYRVDGGTLILGNTYIRVRKNGVNVGAAFHANTSSASWWINLDAHVLVYCSANDTLEVVGTGGQTFTGSGHPWVSFQLIG